jgi:hypothetical protein
MVYKLNIGLIVITLFYLINLAISSKNCKIKVAKNRMSFAKNNDELIYNEGILNPNYLPNTKVPYVTSDDDHIEYFYILEDMITYPHDNHDEIVKKHFIFRKS